MAKKNVDIDILKSVEEYIKEISKHYNIQEVYLFGSYANNTFTNESDLDFYIVVKDDVADIPAETARAYKAIRRVKQRPVDIVLL